MMWYSGASWWMGVSMLVFWAGVIVLIAWAVRGGGVADWHKASRAASILEERFARGEIDRSEFEERRATLEGR